MWYMRSKRFLLIIRYNESYTKLFVFIKLNYCCVYILHKPENS